MTSPFPVRLRGFPPTAVTSKLSSRGHPLVRFPSPAESLEPLPALRLSAPGYLPWGFLPHRGMIGGVHLPAPCFRSAPHRGHPKPASFRPRRFSRPRRIAPPPTSRAYFIPQPRPGFALQGLPLAGSRTGSSPARCPHVVLAVSLPPVLSMGSTNQHPPSGPCSSAESVAHRGGLDRDPPAPLLSFAFLGSFFANLESAFTPSPAMAFLGLRRIEDPRPALLLRARLPVQGSWPSPTNELLAHPTSVRGR